MSKLLAHYERFVIFYSLFGLFAGIGVASAFSFEEPIAGVLSFFVDTYSYAAPFVLYFILAPSLLNLVRQKGLKAAWFSLYVVSWFAKARLIACLFAVFAVSILYGLTPFGHSGEHDANAALSTLATFGRVATQSPYFFAIYAAIGTVAVLYRREERLVKWFAEIPEIVERFGQLLTRIVPLFTFLMGAYIATLPTVLAASMRKVHGVTFTTISYFGMQIDVTSSRGILIVYLLVALTTGLVCSMWHMLLLVYLKAKQADFALGPYFGNYYVKLYPLLWSTCSEALGTPLNMHLVKESYPQVKPTVRHLTISAGTIFSVNGTLTCCFVMIPIVCRMLHIDVSSFSLLLCLPVIYLVGFGIPGIPGELVLFAGPIMGMLGIPAPLQPAFLVVFIGLQIGLPDSFRTGANATEAGPAAFLLNQAYIREFPHQMKPVEDTAAESTEI